MTAWSEGKVAGILARHTFKGDLCVVDNCLWTGYEADLLVVTPSCRIIDVEIKVSRADLKADKHKDKWWHQPRGEWCADLGRYVRPPREPRDWPVKVWKHYYAMPAEIWRAELIDHVRPMSGVLLVHHGKGEDPRWGFSIACVKRAKPRRDAPVLSNPQVIAIARLATLRMWDAYATVERLNRTEGAAA